ncbi:MAG: TonB-dependent receptor [Leptospiraceae bacterium]|nr:TonB-dependent receptor [Leptospiraceae bacterium]
MIFRFIQGIGILFIIVSVNVHSQEAVNRNIMISSFKSLDNKRVSPEISSKIQAEFKTFAKERRYTIFTDNSDSIEQLLAKAKSANASLLIDGYYRKKEAGNLELYVQVYDVNNGSVIDAHHANFEYPELDNIKLDSKEIQKTDDEIISDVAKKTVLKLNNNPNKKVRTENIEDSLISQPVYKVNKFNIGREDTAKSSEEVFKLLQESENVVVTASRTKESLTDVPASTIVITEKDIRNRGYMSIDEILHDLPGFDTIMTQGTDYTTFYQRGYRTPFASRTLFMINGVVENDLWAQVATITRQYPVSNIKRIEVIYGPASAVYGPNAFLGIINVITKDGKDLGDGKKYEAKTSFQYGGGAYNGKSVDAAVNTKLGDLTVAFSAKHYEGTDPDLSNRGGYQSNYWVGNPYAWGPILAYGDAGKPFGKYVDPVNNTGGILQVGYKTLKFGLTQWVKNEGYGPVYPNDKAQPGVMWSKASSHYSIENNVDITSKLNSYTLTVFRDNRIFGGWAEADDFPYNGKNPYSTVSLTSWNSRSKSILFNQNIEYKFNSNFKLITGVKVEFKRLTKEYDVPGYYRSYSSRDIFNTSLNPEYEGGYANRPSTDPVYYPPPGPKTEMPDANTIGTWDRGGFLLGIMDLGKLRLSPGIRYDQNSIYGHSINPRATAVYKPTDRNAIKLLYGEAFNEPSPLQLFGGFSGRQSDLNLRPEKAKTYEAIYMHQFKYFSNEFSIYYSKYENVIKESAKNAGRRKVYGFEYKLKFTFPNFINKSENIGLYFYYTYTEALSSINYDHKLAPIVSDAWMSGDTALRQYEYLYPEYSPNLPRSENFTTLGDIAPHKFSTGINLPIGEKFNFNLRANYVGKRQFYSRNPLNEQGKTLSPYTVLNGAINYVVNEYGFITLKVLYQTPKKTSHLGNKLYI